MAAIDTGPARRMGRTDDVLRSFLGELPDRLRPTEREQRLQVALVWGDDQLLDLQEVEAGATFTLGATPAARMQVHHESTRAGSFPLLAPAAGGGWTVFLPASARCTVRRAGGELTIVDLVEGGLARMIHVPVAGASMPLGLHDRATLQFGNLRVIARYARPAGARRSGGAGAAFWARVAIYVMTAVVVERMVAIAEYDDRSELQGPSFRYVPAAAD